jgi:predicted ABC-type ATPase
VDTSTLWQIPDQNDHAPHILLEEVNKAINRLKLKKASGIHNITAEEIKAATEGIGLHVAHSLCNRIWEEETFPS